MKKMRNLLLATTGVAAATALFAGGALSLPLGKADVASGATASDMVLRVDSDNDHGVRRWFTFWRGDDHEQGEGHGRYDDEDDDDGWAPTGQNAPAPAGTATPPDNGLFLKGATPSVQVN